MVKTALVWTATVVTIAGAAERAWSQEVNTPVPPGWIVSSPPGIFGEPGALRHFVKSTESALGTNREPADGAYVEFGNMPTGEGWISAGPGYRHHVLDGRAVIDASAGVSWNLYQGVQTRFELPHLANDRVSVGAQATYQDLLAVEYFGLGNDSLKSDVSAYRFRNGDLFGYTTFQPTTWLSVSGRFGWIPRPKLSNAEGPKVAFPNTGDLFTDASAPGLRSAPPFLHGDVSIAADWRDHAGHPTRGGVYRLGIAGYSDRDNGTYSFRRYEIEASQFIPLFTPKWILALHGWEVFTDTASGSVVPFYMLPSVGGKNTLRGYTDFRFHDNDLQDFNIESRWAIWSHLDGVGFADFGKVAPRAGDLDFHDLKRSYGVGLRLHNATSTLLRLDVGHSVEGWRVFFKMSDPFKRTTPFSGRMSVAPFVP
jgi:outer membrane protein assembly factor BamA